MNLNAILQNVKKAAGNVFNSGGQAVNNVVNAGRNFFTTELPKITNPIINKVTSTPITDLTPFTQGVSKFVKIPTIKDTYNFLVPPEKQAQQKEWGTLASKGSKLTPQEFKRYVDLSNKQAEDMAFNFMGGIEEVGGKKLSNIIGKKAPEVISNVENIVKSKAPEVISEVKNVIKSKAPRGVITEIENRLNSLIGYEPTGANWKVDYHVRNAYLDNALQEAPDNVKKEINLLVDQLNKARAGAETPQILKSSAPEVKKVTKLEDIMKPKKTPLTNILETVPDKARKQAGKAYLRGDVETVTKLADQYPQDSSLQMMKTDLGGVTKPNVPKENVLYSAKPPIVEKPPTSTPLNQQKLNDIFEQNKVKNLDDLMNRVKLNSNGINNPLIDKPVNPNTFTKLNPETLKPGYLNIESGLPPGGLPPQPNQPKKLISKIFDRTLNTSRNALNKMGEVGKNISARIDKMYNEAELSAGNKVADLQNVVKNLNDNESEQIIKGLRNDPTGLPADNPIVKSVREILNRVYADAKAVGIDVGFRENYAPQLVDMEKLTANKDLAIKHFIDTNQFSTYEKATQFVNDIINGTDIKEAYSRFGKVLPKKMGNLEFQRILDWVPDVLRTDKKMLPDYIEQAYSRIHQVEQFGKNNEIGTNLLKNLQSQGQDANLASKILDQNLGLTKEDKLLRKSGNLARSIQGALKLPLAAISNATQTVNTASRYGTRRTLSTIFKYATGGKGAMEEFALRTGATLDATMQEILDAYKGKSILNKVIAPGFGSVEKFNRVIAANVGRDYAVSLIKKLAANPNDAKVITELGELGINAADVLKSGITDNLLQRAGQAATNLAQFKVRPIDMPTTWSGTLGKVLTQFKSFSYKQSEFVLNQVLKPALKGDVAPLARYLFLGVVMGEATMDIKSTLTGTKRTDNPLLRAGENITAVGGAGYAQSALDALKYGDKGIMEFVAGPTLSDAAKTAANTYSAVTGKPKPLAKQMVESIPFVGRPIVNANKETFTNQAQPKKLNEILKSGNTQDFVDQLGVNPVDEQAISDQITALNKEKKNVYTSNGITIPFINKQVGGLNPQDKASQMAEIDKTIKVLKDQKSLQGVEDYLQPNPKTGIQKYEWDAKQLDWARKIYGMDITDDQKSTLITRMGLKTEDVGYDYVASQETNSKSDYLYNELSAKSHDEVINSLIAGRVTSSSDKMLADNTTLANLRDKGLITNAEYKELIKYKFDKDGKNIGTSAYSGTGNTWAKTQTLIDAFTKNTVKSKTSLKTFMSKKPTTNSKTQISAILKTRRAQSKISDKPVLKSIKI